MKNQGESLLHNMTEKTVSFAYTFVNIFWEEEYCMGVWDKLVEKIPRKKGLMWISIALISSISVGEGYPFAIAIFGALLMNKKLTIGRYLAVLVGVMATGGLISGIGYGLICLLMTMISIWIGMEEDENKIYLFPLLSGLNLGLVGAIVLAVRYIFKLEIHEGVWIALGLEMLMVIGFTGVMAQGLYGIEDYEDYIQSDNILGILMLYGLTFWALPVSLFGRIPVSIGVLGYLLLYLAYRYGVSFGVCMGTLFGTILAIKLHQVEWIAVGVLLSVAGGVVGKWGRIPELFAYGILIATVGVFYFPELLQGEHLRGLLWGGVVFLATPRSYLIRSKPAARKQQQAEVIQHRCEKMYNQVRVYGEMLTELGREFGDVRSEWELRGYPLREEYESRQNALACAPYVQQMTRLGNSILELAAEMDYEVEEDEHRESYLVHCLERQRIRVNYLLMVKGKEGREEIYLSGEMHRGYMMTTANIAQLLSEALGKAYCCPREESSVLTQRRSLIRFREKVPYYIGYGMSRRLKQGQEVSGDQYSQLTLESGQAVMLLSDGMGSGEEAEAISRRFVDLFEEFMQAGFSQGNIIDLINPLLAGEGGGDRFTTMDFCGVDLYTGMGQFIKMGAATTFIRRAEVVESIQSTTLPVGVLPQTIKDESRKKLYHGDMVVMISDGVLEAIPFCNQEQCFQELLFKLDYQNPQELAEALMQQVEGLATGGLRDDATILTMGIWKCRVD